MFKGDKKVKEALRKIRIYKVMGGGSRGFLDLLCGRAWESQMVDQTRLSP